MAHGWPSTPPLDDGVARDVLRGGEIHVVGRMPWSSNATFLVEVTSGDGALLAVYKPQRGERPLWDFPRGTLCRREVAAYEVSEALGWGIVPDTVLRDGPVGFGMVQRFVEHDPEEHYFTLLESHADDFRRMAAFDVVINNADRKAGHCLRDTEGRIRGIDHGVSFHTQWKLRTAIWEFAGESIAPAVCADLHALLAQLRDGLGRRLAELLDRFELDAAAARAERLVTTGVLPAPDPGYHSIPWPLV